jgi:flavin-dependent dehydrogenase
MGKRKAGGRYARRYDVVILGGGLAGQTLARHLLLETSRTVLMVERLEELPTWRQKYGESTVQVAGYYYSRVLELEEYLLQRHYPKYNLRFYWPSSGRDNRGFEDYTQTYIREMSNVQSYQLDRNEFERELLRRNLADPRFALALGAGDVAVELARGGGTGSAEADATGTAGADGSGGVNGSGGADGSGDANASARTAGSARANGSGGETAASPGDHRVGFRTADGSHAVTAGWVIDATGRNRLLARQMQSLRRNPIRHGAFFWWVDGLVDFELLTDRTKLERLTDPARARYGHLPLWLATNHFCGEGYWFWVIPLQGKTSLGIVYEHGVVDPAEIRTPELATAWVCARHPLFERDLPHRKVLYSAMLRDYAHDCARTISAGRWAMVGEAGRFTDPLYSPGSDLISVYNTLIVDAIETGDAELAAKVRLYEQVMRAVYAAYVPSYADSYDALGDPEAFSLKYIWELTIYFAFYVFPFINHRFTDRRFLVSWLKAFSRLGPMNAGMQRLISGYYQWRKRHASLPAEPVYFDFSDLGPLASARKTFYRVGVTVEEARRVLADQLDNVEELARFIAARTASVVLGEPELIFDRDFVAGIDPSDLAFAPAEWRRRWAASSRSGKPWKWRFDPAVMDVFPAVGRKGKGRGGRKAGARKLAKRPAAGDPAAEAGAEAAQ